MLKQLQVVNVMFAPHVGAQTSRKVPRAPAVGGWVVGGASTTQLCGTRELTWVSMSCKHVSCCLSVSMVTRMAEELSSRLLRCHWTAWLQPCSCCCSNLSREATVEGRILEPDWLLLVSSPFVSLQLSDITEQRHHLLHIKQVVTMVTHAAMHHRKSYLVMLRVDCLHLPAGGE